jgi:hypothetical protein
LGEEGYEGKLFIVNAGEFLELEFFSSAEDFIEPARERGDQGGNNMWTETHAGRN